MTSQNPLLYYSDLLILQYIGQPKAYATIQALTNPVYMNNVPTEVQNGFNILTAIGVQLDVLGKYAGVTRNTFDFTGPITLDDSDFRKLIQIKIIQNSAGSSLADIQGLLFTFFGGALRVFDSADMHMDYFFEASIGSQTLAEVFVTQGLLPKPMGVELGALIYAFDINNFWGMRSYLTPLFGALGFSSYTGYNTSERWLSYADAIAP